jgi:predicted nucleic acid-binding protein
VILYLDTSSLLKVFMEEPGSATVVELVQGARESTTSVVAHAEGRAAFARLRRMGDITAAVARRLAGQFEADWHRFAAIDVTIDLARRAGELADRFNLRGFDAIHLASFELVLERAGDEDEVMFSTADDNLARAARRLG